MQHILSCLDMRYTRAIFVAEAYKIGHRGSNSRTLVRGMRSGRTLSVGLVMISVFTLFMTQTNRFVFFSCVDRGIFVTPYPTKLGVSPANLLINQGVNLNGHTTRAPPGVPHTRASLEPGTSGFLTLRIFLTTTLLGGRTLRALRTHIQISKSPACQAAGLSLKEVELETRPL